MQNNIIQNEKDAFSELIRQKLENHQLPVDASSWDAIKARLTTSKKRIIPFWWWLSGGAAVAVLALLFTLRPLTESKDSITTSKTTTIRQEKIQSRHVAKLQLNRTTQQIKKATIHNGLKTQLSDQVKSAIELTDFPTQPVINDSIERNKTIANKIDDSQKTNNDIALKATEKNDSIPKNTRNIPNSLSEKGVSEPLTATKHKRSWLLAAALASNGSVPSGNGNYGAALGDKNIVTASTNYTSIMTPNNFQNITYTPPLSVGLIVRKNLNKVFSLESGLMYTHLLTTFENTGVQRNDARLHLHYIGVPLNLIVQLWNHPKWEIYLSAGGMIDKGIKSVYIQNQYSDNQTITTTAFTDIHGVQWSVNSAVGTTYKIQRYLGIFFEPKISCYFDNNQPISAWTEHSVVIGLTAGVRLQIK